MRTADLDSPPPDVQKYQVTPASALWHLLLGAIIVLFIAPSEVKAANPVQTSAISCSTCASLADLQAAASGYFLNNYFETGVYQIGAIVLVSGVTNPISAFFSEQWGSSCIPYFGCGTHLVAVAITPDNAHTALLDNQLFSRALGLPTVKMPPTLPSNETDELISLQIQATIPISGPLGFNFWHGLLNYPQFQYYKVLDTRTGLTTNVYVGDSITVTYSNGDTEQWQFRGPLPIATVQWTRVPGTLRDAAGHLVVAVPPGSPSAPVNVGFVAPATNWNITVRPPVNFCAAASSEICIGVPGGNDWSCTVAYFVFPC